MHDGMRVYAQSGVVCVNRMQVGVISRNNFTRAIYPLLRRETPKDALLLAKVRIYMEMCICIYI